MKKTLSIFLSVILLVSLLIPTTCAQINTKVERAVSFRDCNYFYVRMNDDVTTIKDNYHIEMRTNKSDEPVILDEDRIQVYSGKRLEFVLLVEEVFAELKICGLVLSDGTYADETLKLEDFEKTETMRSIWNGIERDVLYVRKDVMAYDNDCYVAVGSKWTLHWTDDKVMSDPYLAAHASLKAEDIMIEKQDDSYVFAAVGEGEVSLCLFDIPFQTETVYVLEKQAMKLQMIIPVFKQNFMYVFLTVWAGGFLGLLFSFPMAIVRSIRTLIQVFHA